MLLSDYYLQKYNGAFLAVEKDHVHKSCIFTHLPNGFLEKSYLYNRLQKILNSRACDFFNRHNVIVKWETVKNEINEYFRAISLALLYKSYGTEDDIIPIQDMTLTICCKKEPKKLLKYLRNTQFQCVNSYQNIYYIYKDGHIDTQIVIIKDISVPECAWVDYIFPIRGATAPALTM